MFCSLKAKYKSKKITEKKQIPRREQAYQLERAGKALHPRIAFGVKPEFVAILGCSAFPAS